MDLLAVRFQIEAFDHAPAITAHHARQGMDLLRHGHLQNTVAELADKEPVGGHALARAALHIGAGEHHVDIALFVQHLGHVQDVLGIVRQIGIDGGDIVPARGLETVAQGLAAAAVLPIGHHVDMFVMRRQGVQELEGMVGAAVIDRDDLEWPSPALQDFLHPCDGGGHVGLLVIHGDDHAQKRLLDVRRHGGMLA